MAVISSKIERLSTRRDNKNRNTHRVRYLVESNDRTDEGTKIISGAQSASPHPVPLIFQSYSLFGTFDINSFVQDITAERNNVESPLWSIDVEYRPLDPGQPQEPPGGWTNPLARPTEYWVESETFTERADFDKDENPIVNTAGQAYIDPVEIQNSRTILVAKRNLSSLNFIISLQVTYQNRVNSNPYRGEAPRRWLVRSISAGQQQVERGVFYYEVVWRLALKESGKTWDEKRENKGLMQLVGGQVVPIVRDGIQVIEPVNLTFAGTAGGLTIINTHEVIHEVSFSQIGV